MVSMTAVSTVAVEAVEAAAQALFVDVWGRFTQPENPWLTTFEGECRPRYTHRAELALEAAEPYRVPKVDREAKYDEAFGFAWSALRSIADDSASVETQLQAQRAMDNLRSLYPAATEGLEA